MSLPAQSAFSQELSVEMAGSWKGSPRPHPGELRDQVTCKPGVENFPSAQRSPSAETSLYVPISFSFLRNAATELGSLALQQARLPLYELWC